MIDIKYWLETGIAISTTIGGLVLGWMGVKKVIVEVRKRLAKGSIHDHQEAISADKKIHEYLADLRHETDSCRTKLFQYHNGSSFANGVSMKKMSMTHESCHPGMQPTFRGNTDQVLSLFVDMLELLEKDNATPVVVNSLKDSYFKSYLQSNHVLMVSAMPVRNTDGIQTGCILCEWCGWAFADKVDEDHLRNKFAEVRNSIQYVLSTETKGRRKSK